MCLCLWWIASANPPYIDTPYGRLNNWEKALRTSAITPPRMIPSIHLMSLNSPSCAVNFNSNLETSA
jgi:hypothetical protein